MSGMKIYYSKNDSPKLGYSPVIAGHDYPQAEVLKGRIINKGDRAIIWWYAPPSAEMPFKRMGIIHREDVDFCEDCGAPIYDLTVYKEGDMMRGKRFFVQATALNGTSTGKLQ
jgi:hypothetical protein